MLLLYSNEKAHTEQTIIKSVSLRIMGLVNIALHSICMHPAHQGQNWNRSRMRDD